MNNTFVNIAGKLPRGLVELYRDVSAAANQLDINYLVVGAMARDLVLVQGYGASIERGTRDVDFGIRVTGWDDFAQLKAQLIRQGFTADRQRPHKLKRDDTDGMPWEMDIVPFGTIADQHSEIHWPPDQAIVMSVLGFAEAMNNALNVQVSENPDIVIPVASPAGMALLKLVAWMDREIPIRKKDAMDFAYLIQSYPKIPEVFEAMYDQGCMEAQDWDQIKASAMKLGQDAGIIANAKTQAYLEKQLFNQPAKKEQFYREMQGNRNPMSDCSAFLEIFIQAFQSMR